MATAKRSDKELEQERVARRARYAERKAKGVCALCGAPKGHSKLCEPCRQNNVRRHRNFFVAALHEALEVYGGARCSCCGERQVNFLSLEATVESPPVLATREVGSGSLCAVLRKLGFPPGYRVVCMNCKYGRIRSGGVCPHETGAVEAAVPIQISGLSPADLERLRQDRREDTLSIGEIALKYNVSEGAVYGATHDIWTRDRNRTFSRNRDAARRGKK